MIEFDKYHYLYNADAHFKAQERFPDGYFSLLLQGDKDSFDTIAWFLAELSLQGELVRRYMGEDRGEYLTEEKARHLLTIKQMPEALKIVVNAIKDGLEIEADEDEEVDEVLMELQKKNKDNFNRAKYLNLALSLGMNVREALLLSVREVLEISEARNSRNKRK